MDIVNQRCLFLALAVCVFAWMIMECGGSRERERLRDYKCVREPFEGVAHIGSGLV